MTNYDIAVIGAGAAGGTLALRMARAGWRVAVFERAAFPRRKVCGEYLSPTNLPTLDALGLREKVWQQAGPEVRRTALYFREQVIPAAMPGRAAGGRALGRDSLDATLLSEAEQAGAEVFQPARVESFERRPGLGWVLRDGDGREVTARQVVAAHGSWGAGKLPTFPEKQSARRGDLFGFKAHFTKGQLEDDLMPCFVFAGGYGGLVNADRGRVSFSCCVRRDRLAAMREERPELGAGEAVIAQLLFEMRGMQEALGGAEVDGEVLSTGPIRPGIRSRTLGGVYRIGNAAGEAHPIIAEGISMAIQSAWLLGGALLQDEARAAENYDLAWRRAFAGRIRASGVMARLAMASAWTGCLAPLIGAFPGLLTFGASAAGKGKFVVEPAA